MLMFGLIYIILLLAACAAFVLFIYWIVLPFINKKKIRSLETEIKTLKTKIHDLEKLTADLHLKENLSSSVQPEKPLQPEKNVPPDMRTASPVTENKPASPDRNSFYKPHTSRKTSAFTLALKKFFSVESIISRLGIVLVLIGVGYIFKLSYDNGYIRQETTLVLGIIIGTALTFLGFRTKNKNRIILSQVLFGGGIAVFYITAYAAYLRYAILGNFSAFVFLSLITFFSYSLSVMTTASSISIIGLLGSLIIPFTVGLGFLGLTGFGLYVLAVSFLSAAVYFFKRWKLLQFVSVFSFYVILSWLLSISKLSLEDSILFLGLIIALWVFHTIPDLYYYLKNIEDSNKPFGKSYPSFAAIINFCFSLFLFYKLSVYKPVPQISLYLLFAFFYTGLAYICLRKNKLKNLGITYIAAALISVYITIVDSLSFNIQPTAVLSVALFLYWLWRKRSERALYVFTHIAAAAGYISAFAALIDDYNRCSVVKFFLLILFYLVPMVPCIFLQKEKSKKIIQTFVFQLYVFSAAAMFVCKSISPNTFFPSPVKQALALQVLTVLLFTAYNIMHYKTKEKWFYEKTLYIGPVFLVLFSFLCSGFNSAVFSYRVRSDAVIIASTGIQLAAALGVLGLSFFPQKNSANKFAYRLGFFIVVLKTVLLEAAYELNGFIYALLIAGSLILAADKFYKTDFKADKTALKVFKVLTLVIMFFYYAFVYTDGVWKASSMAAGFIFKINFISLAVNICNALIFINFFKIFKLKKAVYFVIITAIFVFLSVVDVYVPVKNGGLLTLLWAFYSIAFFVYYLRKGNKTMVYTSLACIIIVAAKLIIFDLYTLSILSKVITSIVFGIALLALSYAIQPMLKQFAKNKTGETPDSSN